ncbi:MAG TPA: NAD(P)/FAD-dependent oxidoreductase [Acidimicrobiales bacterium]|nr:NAD(P)/FAD-dependent oxidoreductase [Acidimicrobiales bacterium]
MTPETADSWDVIVIGAGPPGENAADYAGRDGLTTALVERELVGGECSYWACMPSKALLRPAELLGAARAMPGLKEAVGPLALDVASVLDRRDSFTSHHDDSGQVSWAQGAGIDVVRGHGRLRGEKTVEVTTADGMVRTLTARHAVVLATGTRAAVPPIPGLGEALPWTSRDVTNLHEVPEAVVVIGGGVVACESVTWLRALGCRTVTLVEGGARLLGRTEPFAGELVAESLRDAGVILHLGRTVTAVERGELVEPREGYGHGGPVTVTLDDGTTITADEVLVAAGRVPNSDGIGLESVGVSPNAHGYVDVDDHMGVPGTEWLYAIGDLCGKALLTHMGKYQARVAGDVIAARAGGRALDDERFVDLADAGAVPQVTFTEPEVGSVGLTVAEAQERGIDVEAVEYDLGQVAGASLLRDGYTGRANLVIDRRRDVVVGATFVGSGVAELVHSATVAIIGEVPVSRLWHAVPSYPTVSEIWLRLLETLRQQRRTP